MNVMGLYAIWLIAILTLSMFTFIPNIAVGENLLASIVTTNKEYKAVLEDTIPVGNNPNEIAINPINNIVYVTNYQSHSVSVINGTTNKLITNITAGIYPFDIVINPNTKKVYVAHDGSSNRGTSIIDSYTNKVVGSITGFEIKAFNPSTNMAYLTSESDTISVLDDLTNKIVANITDIIQPYKIAVNSRTNMVYVISGGTDKLSVIDGSTNKVVAANITATNPPTEYATRGSTLTAVAVNPVTNMIYVSSLVMFGLPLPNEGVRMPIGSLTIINGSTYRIVANITLPDPTHIAVNPFTNRVYISNSFASSVTIIDGSTNKVLNIIQIMDPTKFRGLATAGIAVNPNTNRVYIVNPSGIVSVIFDESAVAEKEWKIYKLSVKDQVFKIPYKITNAIVTEIEADPDNAEVVIAIKSSEGAAGTIDITVPRELIASNISPDVEPDVEVNGVLVKYMEVNKSSCFRTLSINFDVGSEKIMIFATRYPEPIAKFLPPSVYVTTDKSNYEKDETTTVSGCTSLALDDKEVMLEALDPQGEIYTIPSVAPNIDGSFSTSLVVVGQGAINGTYTIRATYAGNSATSSFVVPEFPFVIVIASVGIGVVLTLIRFRRLIK